MSTNRHGGCWACKKAPEKLDSSGTPTPSGEIPHDRHLNLCVGQTWTGIYHHSPKSIEFEAGSYANKDSIHFQRLGTDPVQKGIYTEYDTQITIGAKVPGAAWIMIRYYGIIAETGKYEWYLGDSILIKVNDCNGQNNQQKNTWDWSSPRFLLDEYYSGEKPECSYVDAKERGFIETAGLILENKPNHYDLLLGANSKWSNQFQDLSRVKAVTSSNEEVAQAHFHRLAGVVVHAKEPGHAVIQIKAAALPLDYSSEKYRDIEFKNITVDVFVIANKDHGELACPDDIMKGEEEDPNASCCANPNPNFQGPLPEELSNQAKAWMQIILPFYLQTTSKECDYQMIERQVNKIVHAYFELPDWRGYQSCVSCALFVGETFLEAIQDEPVACVQLQNVMTRRFLPFKILGREGLPRHAVTAVGPAGVPLSDDWYVFDTFKPLGNVPLGVHEHTIWRLGEWRRRYGYELFKIFTGRKMPEGEIDIDIESLTPKK